MHSKVVIETLETQAHRIILNGDGIVRIYSKPSHITSEDVNTLLAKLDEIRNGERLTVIMDPTQENSMTSEAKSIIMHQMKERIAILGVVTRKRFIRTLFLFFRSFKDLGVNMKMFKCEEDAKEWISSLNSKRI